MNTKRNIILTSLLIATLFTGCAAEDSANISYKNESAVSAGESYDEELNYDGMLDSETGEVVGSNKENNTDDKVIRKEMLVYSCNMTVDVLDFDAAISAFRRSLDTYGAFIEKETYSDGGSYSKWYDSSQEKWQTYNATVRVPSQSYDQFCNSASDLGDLRSKNANVDNLSREYYDLSTELEIYEARKKRYMDLLDSITDKEYAISVEKELADIEINISKIKTRMNTISTDVAYSYVYITINEVREYKAEPVKTDTFGQRFMNTVEDATSSFLSVMEGLLFILIYMLPYLIIFAICGFVFYKIVKLIIKKGREKSAAKPAVNNAPVQVQNQPMPPRPQAPQPAPKEENKDNGEKKN